jgi:hypothetical protein
VHQSISSWSDSYYDIGPAAYAFISYSHWHEPSYAQYIEPAERNVQIISETKNVTNIVTNNNVINNFGPPVQTVATKTNQNIPQVKLALTSATDPNANYGQTMQGNQLNVVAPSATLKRQATHAPPVQNRIVDPQVEKGWQGVKPQDAEKLKKTIAEQNPAPKGLPKPTPFVNPQIGNKGQVTGSPAGSPGAIGSSTAVAGQKTPPNLVKPGAGSPSANVTPGTSPNAETAGKKPVPPNLLGSKPSGTPGASPTVKPAGSPTGPGGKPTPPGSPGVKQSPSAPKGTPPNLNAPRPSATPGQGSQGNEPPGSSTPKPAGNLPPGQNTPVASATPHIAATPTQEKPETTPTPTPHGGPANLPMPKPTSTPHQPSNQEAPEPTSTPRHEPASVTTPKPTPEVKAASLEISTPKPTPHREPLATPKPTPLVKATPPPTQEIKTPTPQILHAPAPEPQVLHNSYF